MKRHLWTVLYSLALGAFTLFLALDTFVLRSAYRSAEPMNTTVFDAQPTPEAAPVPVPAATEAPGHAAAPAVTPDALPQGYTESSYRDGNMRVELTERMVHGTRVYIADVRVSSAAYLKTAFAGDTYGKNVTEKTSEIAIAHNAVLAINGDYYGAQEKGLVLRNGVVYRKKTRKQDLLCVWADGSMEILDGSAARAEELAERSAWQVFCFGPGLVDHGELTVTPKSEVRNSMASNPRTAIGMIEPCHYLFVVSDGRTEESAGLSLYELGELMRELGAQTAYNLDGGGSSCMVFRGKVVNQPTSYGKNVRERGVSDIVYVG